MTGGTGESFKTDVGIRKLRSQGLSSHRPLKRASRRLSSLASVGGKMTDLGNEVPWVPEVSRAVFSVGSAREKNLLPRVV